MEANRLHQGQQATADGVGPSVGAFPWALHRFKQVSPQAKIVFVVMWTLAECRETSGRPYNSADLGAEMRCDPRSVRKCWSQLVDAGLIELVKDGKYDQEYKVNDPARVLRERVVAPTDEEQTELDFEAVETADVVPFVARIATEDDARRADHFAAKRSGADQRADQSAAKRSAHHGHNALDKSKACHGADRNAGASQEGEEFEATSVAAPPARSEPPPPPQVERTPDELAFIEGVARKQQSLGVSKRSTPSLGPALGAVLAGVNQQAQRGRDSPPPPARSGSTIDVEELADELHLKIRDKGTFRNYCRKIARYVAGGKLTLDRVRGSISEIDADPGIESRGRVFAAKVNEALGIKKT
jgi:hypothetical protein